MKISEAEKRKAIGHLIAIRVILTGTGDLPEEGALCEKCVSAFNDDFRCRTCPFPDTEFLTSRCVNCNIPLYEAREREKARRAAGPEGNGRRAVA